MSAFQALCSVLQAPPWIQLRGYQHFFRRTALMADDGEGRGLLTVFGEPQISQSPPQSREEGHPAQAASAVLLWRPVAVPRHLPPHPPDAVTPRACSVHCLQPYVWTVAPQTPLSMGFSREECWSGLPFPPPGNLPNLGIKPVCLTYPALAGGFFTTSATWEVSYITIEG